MRLYYVIRDISTTKRNPDQRKQLLSEMAVRDLEGDTPNRQFAFHKVDATGTAWFGGIDLDAPALEKLADRRKGEPETKDKLAALLQAELRSVLLAGERSRFTVEVVVADDNPLRASELAMAWLATNWGYGDAKPAADRT